MSRMNGSSAVASSTSLQRRRWRVRGLVQGVFYRKYTQRQAQQLGVTGYVRNCDDGSVEVLAEGSAGQLTALRRWCRHTGSPRSRVVQVDELPLSHGGDDEEDSGGGGEADGSRDVATRRFATFDIRR